MIADVLYQTLQPLKSLDISAIVVGEFALNYYNVPCVLYEIEICVSKSQMSASEHALTSSADFERLPQAETDLYTAYKQGCPRFLNSQCPNIPLVLLAEVDTKFNRLKSLHESEHTGQVYYSKQILDSLPVENIQRIHFPTLPSLMQYCCRLYFESRDVMYRIRLEQLVDGMNVDHQWCETNLSDQTHYDLVLELANGKKSRIDDFMDNSVTCMIPDQETATCVIRIPGYQDTE